MAETDLSTWLTVEEAATAIGVSTRTVERLGKAGKLDQRLRRQEGTPPVAVYYPGDVERERVQRHPTPPPFVLEREQDGPTNGNGSVLLTRSGAPKIPGPGLLHIPAGDDSFQQLCAALVRLIQSPPSPPVSESVAESKAFLTIPEAAQATGLSPTFLRKMIKLGTLPAIKDKAWKIRRKDLAAL